jgi:tetratricopeptide (TPR) repeat protein
VLVAMLASTQPASVAEVGDHSGSAVERFLKWEPDEARRQAALYGALPRRFSAEVFAVAAGSSDHLSWLLHQPFVTEQADGFHYHDVVRTQMLRVLRRREPEEWRSRHLALATATEPLERAYHLLCADRAAALPQALEGLITAFSVRRSMSTQWASMILQAGRETDSPEIVRRGTELVETTDYTERIGLLVDDRSLPAPARALAHAQRGILLRRNRFFDEALADFEAALRLTPDWVTCVGERGETLRRMGRPAEAVPDLDRLLAVNPEDDWALGCRGAAFQALDRLEESLVDLDKSLALRPKYVWALGARAETLIRMERYPEALADAERALELDADYAYGLARRAIILLAMGEQYRAAADLNRIVDLGGSSSPWAQGQLDLIQDRRTQG